jgi:regulator of replication initiation timing
MESRVARLEASIEHIERDIAEIKNDGRAVRQVNDHLRDRLDGDFRITWAGVIALGLGLAGLMAKGFGWL